MTKFEGSPEQVALGAVVGRVQASSALDAAKAGLWQGVTISLASLGIGASAALAFWGYSFIPATKTVTEQVVIHDPPAPDAPPATSAQAPRDAPPVPLLTSLSSCRAPQEAAAARNQDAPRPPPTPQFALPASVTNNFTIFPTTTGRVETGWNFEDVARERNAIAHAAQEKEAASLREKLARAEASLLEVQTRTSLAEIRRAEAGIKEADARADKKAGEFLSRGFTPDFSEKRAEAGLKEAYRVDAPAVANKKAASPCAQFRILCPVAEAPKRRVEEASRIPYLANHLTGRYPFKDERF
jgi:hypothetical protein